jgi:hypothetical protein
LKGNFKANRFRHLEVEHQLKMDCFSTQNQTLALQGRYRRVVRRRPNRQPSNTPVRALLLAHANEVIDE